MLDLATSITRSITDTMLDGERQLRPKECRDVERYRAQHVYIARLRIGHAINQIWRTYCTILQVSPTTKLDVDNDVMALA